MAGRATNAKGYFVIGTDQISPPPDVIINYNQIQNGADAVALYYGQANDFLYGTAVDPPPLEPLLLDALVYDTTDGDDAELLLLHPGEEQINENTGGDGTTNSNQRCTNWSGGQMITRTFIQAPPSPAAPNCPPPTVPDGTFGIPMTAEKADTAGSTVNVTWDTSCLGTVEFAIIYGGGSQLPTSPGGLFIPTDGVCAIGTSSPYPWVSVPDPTIDPSNVIWWLIVATDRGETDGVESSWGSDSSGTERNGPGANGSSDICGIGKDLSNICLF